MIGVAEFKRVIDKKEGEHFKVTEFTDARLASKLMTMGVMPGSWIEIVCIAPWKGGYCLKVNGQKIAVRYNEAASILVA